jgi:hypothetical protein
LLIPFVLAVVGAVFLVLGVRTFVRTLRCVGQASSATSFFMLAFGSLFGLKRFAKRLRLPRGKVFKALRH